MNNKELLFEAIKISLQAGAEILNIYNNEDFEISIKSDSSPVTQADKIADNLIVSALEKTNIPIFSEEGNHTDYEIRKNWTRFWLIDPLDGTKEFINKNGEFTVNIALIENQKAVMGVIYLPVLNDLYFGSLEFGAYKISDISEINSSCKFEKLLEKSQKLPLISENKVYTLVGSRSHKCEITDKYFKEIEKEKGEIKIITKGSSLKFCMIAEGIADLYPRFNSIMEWDTAAGHAIILSSGGTFTQADGSEFLYNKKDIHNPYFIAKKG